MSVTQEAHIFTISQITNAIKLNLEATFPHIWLQGEVSNCKLHTSGHLYFSLKDSQAQIAAVMYRADVAALKILPKDGDQIIVRGEINVYPQAGRYQVVVRELKLSGLGELLLKLEELKAKLHKKGWFKAERKRPLPKFPRTIGIVTSPTGAAIQDILKILTRRLSGFHLILNPVKVQGEGAAQEIAQAIIQFNQYNLVDVMIVGRGGGSMEDLWAFNEEIVAEAIFNSRIPIVCAVGHETDHCIAEYVADVRAPTPSAAAEIVSAETAQYLKQLGQLHQRMQQTVTHLIRQDRRRLEGVLRHPVLSSPYALLGPWMQKTDDIRIDLEQGMKQLLLKKRLQLETNQKILNTLKPLNQIQHFKQKLAQWERGLTVAIEAKIGNMKQHLQPKQRQIDYLWQQIFALHKERLEKISEALHAVNPKNLLTKGYSILFSEKDHSAITSVRELEKQRTFRILMSDGEASATINKIFPH